MLTGKTPAVISFSLQNAPEALHWTVINAMRHAGHTLCHPSLNKLVVKCPVGILKASVTVEQGMCIRIGLNCLVKGLENQWIVVALTEHIGHNTPIAEIQNGAQIEFVNLDPLIPLEFCHIGEPLLIRFCSIKLPVQKILGKILRVLSLSGTAVVVVLYRGTDISGSTDTKHSLVVDTDAVVMSQIVIEPSVPLIRTFRMDLLNLVCEAFIFYSPAALLSGSPFVVSRACHMKQLTGQLNGIPFFLVRLPDRSIDVTLSYFRKASLLSTSSNFFSRSRSISARYSLCLSCSISICAFSCSVRGV